MEKEEILLYEPPAIDVMEVNVEAGFTASSTGENYRVEEW